jgi:hypothetical protein
MEKKKIKRDKAENRFLRIASTIANMNIGEKLSPTKISKTSRVHPSQFREVIDFYDVLKDIGFETIRAKKGDEENFLKLIIRTDSNLDIKKEIRELRKEMLDVKTSLDELKLIKR